MTKLETQTLCRKAPFRPWGFGLLSPLCALLITVAASAQVVVQDGFESGSFATGWSLTSGVTITATGGANGSTRCATLATYSASAGRELGARFDSVAPDGARDFSVDFHFRAQNTTQRRFNLHVSTSTGAVGSGAPAINLKYDAADGWAAYNGSWQKLTALGSVSPAQWYRLRIMGSDWGFPTARYAIAVSAAGGTNFIASVTNLTFYQGGTPTALAARYFVFTSVYGNGPGFDVDEVAALVAATPPTETNAIRNLSGTYPHLAVFSSEGEIGLGAVASWADRLWFITYPPHRPTGSADKLWMVDSNLTLAAHPASVGGTHANRFIHRETQQLNLGPYFIDTNANVRVIPPAVMPGRLTGSARHLTDPANQIYIATMEEGLYEVDVNTLAVTELYHDMNTTPGAGQRASGLPGTHGKGLYSAQGRLVYANNGDGGVLASWDGASWSNVTSAKFTEVTGPGGIHGNPSGDDRLWALGWDTRSVILKLLEAGAWQTYRLPKASYTHDANHGWFTEWPRIREVTDGKLLMHMHGMFWYFPKTFAAANTGGLQPICTHLKMPVDYCWWNGQLVMARDDASTTGGNVWTGQSHSAPWFGQLSDLERWGAAAGFGGPWLNDAVTANTPSEPFFVQGFHRRVLHLKHAAATPVNFAVQYDAEGTGAWQTFTNLTLSASGYAWLLLPPTLNATWLRLVPDGAATGVTAYFHLQNPPQAPAPELFVGLADAIVTNGYSDGIIRPPADARTLQFAATMVGTNGAASTAYYEISGALSLRRATNTTAENTLRTTYGLATNGFTLDAASVIYTEGTNRFRLPRGNAAYDAAFPSGWPRSAREVVTERQLFNAHGTIYELPYAASGGFRRIRPVTTHNRHVSDFASWRGLLVIAGVAADATNSTHVVRSDDGQAALWLGGVDDLWRLGAPAGVGGPWKETAVTANTPSDPYLMFGYERKVLELAHTNATPVTFIVEVDFAADNSWSEYTRFTIVPGQTFQHAFPDSFSAHWVRLRSDTATRATAQFSYGPAAPQITGAAMLPGRSILLTFTGGAGQRYSVRGSSEVGMPLATWPLLATGTFTSQPAQFADSSATNLPRRFYTISVP
jgi:hypothetical protein